MTHRYDDPRLQLAVEAASSTGPVTHLCARELGIRRLGGIEQLGELRWLDLAGNPLTSVTELRANTKLRRLILKNTGMSTLRGLEGLPELEDLDLYSSRVLAIPELEGLPLRSLDLGLCIVPKLGPLATLIKLESLTLGNPRLHIGRGMMFAEAEPLHLDLSAIRQLSSLRQLRLYNLRISSAKIFEQLVNLEELTLDYCVFGDRLRELPELPRLELLSLEDCELPDLRALASLPRLRVLQLDESKLTDVTPLLACPALEQLSLRKVEIEQRDHIERLREHPRLFELRLDHRLIAL